MFSLVLKTPPPSIVEPAKRGFSTVLKANPYHDDKGRFTSKEKANYQGAKLFDTIPVMSQANDALVGSGGGTVEDYLKSPLGKKMVAEAANWHWKYSKNAKATGEMPGSLEAYVNAQFGKSDGTAVVAKIQASLNAKKAWVKIYQKKSLDYLEGEYVEDMASVMTMQDGLAKDKLIAKIKKKYEHAKQQYTSNDGEDADFMKATQKAYDKVVVKSKELGATIAEKVATVPEAGTGKPKWEDPDGPASAFKQNETLGVAYYKLTDKLGKEHPDVKEAYAEWQKSKDWLSANTDTKKFNELSAKQKSKAQQEISQEANALAAKAKADAEELSSFKAGYKASLQSYSDALDSNSTEGAALAHLAQLNSYESLLKKKGLTDQDISVLSAEATAQVEATKKAKKAVEKLLGEDLSKKISYYDQNPNKFKTASEHLGYKTRAVNIVDSLSEEQRKAIRAYTGSGYTQQNKAAVANMQGEYQTALNQAMILSDAMKDKTIGYDLKLRRNAAQKWFWQALGVPESKMDDLTESELTQYLGRTYTEKAFSSVSKRTDFTGAFSTTASKSGAIRMNIRATKDIRGIDVSTLSNHEHEAEIILDRGVTYVIRGLRKVKNDGMYRYEVDVDAIGHV